MPKRFTFKVKRHNAQIGSRKATVIPKHSFTCKLKGRRCKGRVGAVRCKRNTIIGTSWCWQHLLKTHFLRIKTSKNPSYGKGLFAERKGADFNRRFPLPVFVEGDVIVEYLGEKISQQKLDERYPGDDVTAPYTFRTGAEPATFIDAACHRGVGSMINHDKRRANAKAVEGDGTDGRQHIIQIIATKRILTNEEILINYADSDPYGRADYKFNDQNVTHTTYNSKN